MCLNRTNRTGGILYRLFFYLPVIWAALLIAQSLGGGLPDLFSNLTAALEHPFQIQWTDKSLLTILICTGGYIMSLCIYDAESGRTRDGQRNTAPPCGARPGRSTRSFAKSIIRF